MSCVGTLSQPLTHRNLITTTQPTCCKVPTNWLLHRGDVDAAFEEGALTHRILAHSREPDQPKQYVQDLIPAQVGMRMMNTAGPGYITTINPCMELEVTSPLWKCCYSGIDFCAVAPAAGQLAEGHAAE